MIDAPFLFEVENSGAIMKEDSSWVDRIEETLIAVILGTMALLLFRFIQAGILVWKGKIDMMIVSHEAEEDVDEANKAMAAEEKK